MKDSSDVIDESKKILSDMIRYYCQKKHNTTPARLCEECANLLSYSYVRLDNCRYGENKPTCRKCKTHCYNASNRKAIKGVMRFSGSRLFLRSPIKWLKHILRDLR